MNAKCTLNQMPASTVKNCAFQGDFVFLKCSSAVRTVNSFAMAVAAIIASGNFNP